jgi:hypothetical protein
MADLSHNTMHGELDRLIDATLAKNASVEPHPALEARILAHLRSEQPKPTTWWQLASVATAATAAAVAAVLIVARLIVPSDPRIVAHPSSEQHVAGPMAHLAHHDVSVLPAPRHKTQKRPRIVSSAVASPAPKLDQFPSPQPLSAEEVALAQYAKNFPKEAQFVAQAQAEFDLETRKAMDEAGSGTLSSGSIQQER